jgi:hypothetical protein
MTDHSHEAAPATIRRPRLLATALSVVLIGLEVAWVVALVWLAVAVAT